MDQFLCRELTVYLGVNTPLLDGGSAACSRWPRFIFIGRLFYFYLSIKHNVMWTHSVMSDSLWPLGLQRARPPCPSPTSGAYSNSCPLSWWCHLAISSSVIPSSSHLQSFSASGSFPVSQFFSSGSQSIGVSASASVFPMNIHDWFPLGWTG